MRRGEQRKANHADVKERGGKGRHGEAVPGIQDGAHQRRQRNQQNIGEGYPQQLRRQGKFIRRVGKARRRYHDYPGRCQHPQDGHDRQRQRQ